MVSIVRIKHRKDAASSEHVFEAQLGRHIRTDPSKLAKYCYNDLGVVSEDLATIVEAAALADRLIPRLRSVRWARNINLEIPVFERAAFERSEVQGAMLDALNFLTGDDWAISFIERLEPRLQESYLPLVRKSPRYVVPYSNGLDSFAQAKLLEASEGKESILKVRAGTLEATDSRIDVPVLKIPRGFQMGRAREQTYRTRPLVFYTFAAITAVTAKAEAVVIGETGQGSLGPSFAIFADEWPLRSSHPGFLWRLEKLIAAVLETPVTFLQPQLWRTKGQVLVELAHRGLSGGWEKTKSCSLRPKERRGRGACGFCGGCMLRRVSAFHANLHQDEEYAFDAGSINLELSTSTKTVVEMSLNDRQILSRSASSMSALAGAARDVNSEKIIAREIHDLPDSLKEEAKVRMPTFLRAHASEWNDFLAHLPASAWMTERFYQHE